MPVDLTIVEGFDYLTTNTDLSQYGLWTSPFNKMAWLYYTAPGLIAGYGGSGQALRLATSAGGYTSVYGVSDKWQTMHVGFKFRTSTVSLDQMLVAFIGDAGSNALTVRLSSSGQIYVLVAGTAFQWDTTTSAVLANTWYHIEFAARAHYDPGGNHQGSFWLARNGLAESELNKSAVPTSYLPSQTVSSFGGEIRWENDNNFDLDDVYVRVGSGDAQSVDQLSTAINSPRVKRIKPNAEGFYGDMVPVGSSLHYDTLDEDIGNGNTDYLHNNPPSGITLSECVNMEGIGGEIVHGLSYVISRDTVWTITPFLRLDGADYEYPAVFSTYGGAYKFDYVVWEKSPATGDAFTVSDINNIQAGMRVGRASSVQAKVSLLHLNILLSDAAPSPPPTPFITGVLNHKTHHLATCWHIKRQDGRNFFFTDHNRSLTLFDGNTYEPAGGFNASARRSETAGRGHDMEVVGAVTSDRITVADLRANLYDEAEVIEYVVDYRVPWDGAVRKIRRWVETIAFDDAEFVSQMIDQAGRLRRSVGRRLNRLCGYRLGQPGCNVLMTPHTFAGCTVDTVGAEPRRTFTSNSVPKPTLYLNDGELLWTSGANAGVLSIVRYFESQIGPDIYELHLPTPHNIGVGDNFTVKAGCNKRADGDCKNKFNNVLNFEGMLWVPGMDDSIKSRHAF